MNSSLIIFTISILFPIIVGENYTREKRQYFHEHPPNYPALPNNQVVHHHENLGWKPEKCKSPMPCLDPKSIPHQGTVDATWLQTPRAFYQVMGSCWGLSELAKIHLGRPVQSEAELEQMCPVQLHRNNTGYYSGYGTQFQNRCVKTPEDTGRVCINVAGDHGTATNVYSRFRYYVIQTDGKSFALFYRCVQRHFADYALVSSRPTIDPHIAHNAVQQVVQMGFPEDQVKFLGCKTENSPQPNHNQPHYNDYQ